MFYRDPILEIDLFKIGHDGMGVLGSLLLLCETTLDPARKSLKGFTMNVMNLISLIFLS